MIQQTLAPRVLYGQRSNRELRWLTALLFLPLAFCQTLGVPGATAITDACGFGWLFGICLLLWVSDKPTSAVLWAWTIVFVFFMGIYLKYFAFAFGIGSPLFEQLTPELSWVTRTDLNDALVLSTIGFLSFAITATFALKSQAIPNLAKAPSPELISHKAVYWILALVFIGVVGSLLAALVFGFGQMGLEHHELPFHLDALFTRFRISLAPAVFIVALWLTDSKRTRSLWICSMVTMIVCALLDAYVRGSRGSVVLAFVPLMFLWFLTGTFTAGRKALAFGIVLLTIALFPILTGLRGERIASGHGADFDQEVAAKQASSSEGIALSLDQVAGRIVGIDSMMQVQNFVKNESKGSDHLTTMNLGRIAWLANGAEMVIFMTYTVVGIPEEVVEGRSPGFLGGLYLVGGSDGMVLLTVIYVIAVAFIWRHVSKHAFAAPLLAYLASVILSYTEEGVFGLENPVSALLAVLIVVWLFKRFVIRRSRTLHSEVSVA